MNGNKFAFYYNDDGISRRIKALENALLEVGDVFVVAPIGNDGASHSLTLARPPRIRQIDEGMDG